MLKLILLSGIVLCFMLSCIPGIGANVETERLIIRDITGTTLEQPEAKWLEALKSMYRDKMGNISTLVKLWSRNPNNACFSAQDLARGKR